MDIESVKTVMQAVFGSLGFYAEIEEDGRAFDDMPHAWLCESPDDPSYVDGHIHFQCNGDDTVTLGIALFIEVRFQVGSELRELGQSLEKLENALKVCGFTLVETRYMDFSMHRMKFTHTVDSKSLFLSIGKRHRICRFFV